MCWYPHKYWSQHLDGGERYEKFKASLRYIVESHPRLHDTSSQVTGEKGTKEQERKKELKKKCEKAKWKERTEEKDLASFILTDSPRKTSRSPHPCAALHTVNFFCVSSSHLAFLRLSKVTSPVASVSSFPADTVHTMSITTPSIVSFP